MQRRIREHAEPVQSEWARETRTRSWRIAKRLEDNTPPEPDEDAVVDADLTGRVMERSDEMLTEAQHLLELEDNELAALFAVASPAMEHWRRRGVPAPHSDRLACIPQAVLTLRSHGRERTIAELARLTVPEADGASVLDLLHRQPIDMEAVTAACVAVQSRGSSHPRLPVEPDETVERVMERQPVTVDAREAVREAARRMRSADIGDVLVLEHGRLAGMLTDRDIVLRVIAAGRDPGVTTCGQVASRELQTVSPDAPLSAAIELMRRHAVRRLPVVEEGRVVGTISLADLATDRDPDSVLAAIAAAPSSE